MVVEAQAERGYVDAAKSRGEAWLRTEIASLAVAQDPKWSGKIDSEVVDGKRITRLTAQRNDESIEMTWRGAVYLGGTYRLFDHAINLASASVARSKITVWNGIQA
jgi:hypothetical protein